MFIKKISILKNNYVWIIHDINKNCIIIDPGEARSILKTINKEKWKIIGILLTHHHFDHVDGVKEIINKYPNISIFGPKETESFYVNQIVQGGDVIKLLDNKIYVFSTPGHTLEHISYYLKPYFFCGDVLFSGGCGRVYKNEYTKMYRSICLINSFPGCTLLCCGHEYTLSNLYFSISILPNNQIFKKYLNLFLKKNVPVYLCNERKINIFLRIKEVSFQEELGLNKKSELEIFTYLRLKKNIFT